MKRALSQVLAVVLVVTVPASSTLAQQAPQPAPAAAEPVALTLPMGAQVRLQTKLAPGRWTKGVLVSADAASVAIVPEDAPPLGANQLGVPTTSIARFELRSGSKRHTLIGLAAGMALGVLLGVSVDVDAEACGPYDDAFCSRGEALVGSILVIGGIGAGVGALVKTDRWTPVALDALGPPAPRVSGVAPRLRVLPGGGVSLGLAVGF